MGNKSIIDDYLVTAADVLEEDKAIVRSWKRAVTGTVYIERNVESGSIFINGDSQGNARIYRVLGVASSFKELFPKRVLPTVVRTALLPSRNIIISDGLFGGKPGMVLRPEYAGS